VRFLHCADLHIGCGGDETFGAAHFARIADAALKAEADALLIAGDLFDRTAKMPAAAQSAAACLRPLKAAGVAVFAVEGNHDCGPPAADGLTLLREEGRLRLLRPSFDSAGRPNLAGCLAEHKGVRIAGFGYLGENTRERLAALLALLPPWPGATVCMLHTGVYEKAPPRGGLLASDMEWFEGKAVYVALGHRHAREEHGLGRDPGAPAGVRLRGTAAPRGYYIAETREGGCAYRFFPMEG